MSVWCTLDAISSSSTSSQNSPGPVEDCLPTSSLKKLSVCPQCLITSVCDHSNTPYYNSIRMIDNSIRMIDNSIRMIDNSIRLTTAYV